MIWEYIYVTTLHGKPNFRYVSVMNMTHQSFLFFILSE